MDLEPKNLHIMQKEHYIKNIIQQQIKSQTLKMLRMVNYIQVFMQEF